MGRTKPPKTALNEGSGNSGDDGLESPKSGGKDGDESKNSKDDKKEEPEDKVETKAKHKLTFKEKLQMLRNKKKGGSKPKEDEES